MVINKTILENIVVDKINARLKREIEKFTIDNRAPLIWVLGYQNACKDILWDLFSVFPKYKICMNCMKLVDMKHDEIKCHDDRWNKK